jgi:hypothetical protein
MRDTKMIEIGLLLGLGTLGYVLAKQSPPASTKEGFINALMPRPLEDAPEDPMDNSKGHGN